jgi:hypothetical protein
MKGPCSPMAISTDRFDAQFAHFRDSVRRASTNGSEFRSFHNGLAAQWEDYKPRLREHALSLLDTMHWREDGIGRGEILNNVIASIEIEGGNDRNNLVRWVNRFGHANRSHYSLLDARLDRERRSAFEKVFFDFYLDRSDDATVFEALCTLAGRRYDLLAYLFFLKDMSRFMPIATRTLDEAFALLDIDLVTTGQCSWENYTRYNNVPSDVQSALRERAGVPDARLIDAHSFCWMLIRLDKEILSRPAFGSGIPRGRSNTGTIYDARQIWVYEMANVIEQTVRNSNGQVVERVIKNKELRMTRPELENLLLALMIKQENRCALTGIQFHFPREPNCDEGLLPSPDRIDSNGHYESSNLQVVCRFVNFWKSNSDNEEFRRLLTLVRASRDDETG